MKARRLAYLSAALLCAALALFACSKRSTGAHVYGAGGAGQVGQGPIPEFANVAALGAQSTYGLSTGFIAMVGQNIYVLSTTSAFTVDGTNVVTGSGGGQWLRSSSGTALQTIPAAQAQATWVVDPGNVSGCASDANATCSSSSCTSGDGPCLTKAQVLSRWGSLSPRIRQTTTLTQLSNDTTNADPFPAKMQLENGAQFAVQGLFNATTAVCTGTLLAITAKAQTSVGTTLQSTFTLTNSVDGGACTIAVGQYVVNATHAGKAMVLRNVSGGNWLLSQPMASNTCTAPSAAAEVNTWANGDTVTLYAPTKINVTALDPTLLDNVGQFAAAPGAGAGLCDAVAYDPNVYGDAGILVDPLVVGPNGYLVEAESQRVLSLTGTDVSPQLVSLGSNSWAQSGIIGGPSRSLPSGTAGEGTRLWSGGAVGGTTCQNLQASDLYLDLDVAIEPCTKFQGLNNSDMGVVLIDSTTVLHAAGTIGVTTSAITGNLPLVYGAGTLNLAADARAQYPSGASNAAATFKLGTFTADNQTKGCSTLPSSSTITCNLTFSAAQADTSLGATSGCLGPLGGAELCNYGP